MNGSEGYVLIVDNDEAFLQLARALFEEDKPSLEVRTARSGSEALAFLERHSLAENESRIALIVLDFRLPDIDAPEVLRRIRTIEGVEETPVLVLSQGGWWEDEAASLAAGALQFAVKPSRIEALEDMLIGFWRSHGRGSTKDPAD